MSAPQLAFPWWNESARPRRRYLLDWFEFLSAYARVCKRFNDTMQAEQDARDRDAMLGTKPEGLSPGGVAARAAESGIARKEGP